VCHGALTLYSVACCWQGVKVSKQQRTAAYSTAQHGICKSRAVRERVSRMDPLMPNDIRRPDMCVSDVTRMRACPSIHTYIHPSMFSYNSMVYLGR
jgi:hypothetical protein